MTEKQSESRPIRVLAVVYRLKPGGLENRLMDILRNIDTSRVIIDVFTHQIEPGDYDGEVRQLGGRVYYNPRLTVRNIFWYVRYFRDFLKNHPEYRIVHAHQDAWCSVFCKGAYLAGVPVRIAHSRTAISSNTLGYMVKNIIKLPTRKYANHYFAVSKKAGMWLYGRHLFASGKVKVWPNAIEAVKYYYNEKTRERVRMENGWNNRYVVMHVGNFTYPKNHPFILNVFREVRARDKDAILVLVGDGDRSTIDDYINTHDMTDSVQLMGTRYDVNELLQGADVFLFPSIFEGMPGAMIEAQAAGVPCVLSDTISEEVCIVPCLKVLSLSAGINTWAGNVLEYKTYERTDTRRYVEEKGFDVRATADKLCSFYEDVYEKEVKNNGISRSEV